MKPLVSIIMGAYNCADTLQKCIDSIIAQTYTNWEFIICNDCSTDKTLDILKKNQKADSRIIVLSNKKNCRLAASLNHCLKYAKGKYIARMDADDVSLPNRLEAEVNFLEEHPEYDVVGCSMIIFDGENNEYIRRAVEYPKKEMMLKFSPFAHPTIMMKKSVYDALNGYTVNKKTMRAEDLELWFRFFEKGYQGYNIQKPLYRYREFAADYKKRTLNAAIQTSKVYLDGYKRLNFPKIKWIYMFKPIISASVPVFIMKWYHKRKK